MNTKGGAIGMIYKKTFNPTANYQIICQCQQFISINFTISFIITANFYDYLQFSGCQQQNRLHLFSSYC